MNQTASRTTQKSNLHQNEWLWQARAADQAGKPSKTRWFRKKKQDTNAKKRNILKCCPDFFWAAHEKMHKTTSCTKRPLRTHQKNEKKTKENETEFDMRLVFLIGSGSFFLGGVPGRRSPWRTPQKDRRKNDKDRRVFAQGRCVFYRVWFPFFGGGSLGDAAPGTRQKQNKKNDKD